MKDFCLLSLFSYALDSSLPPCSRGKGTNILKAIGFGTLWYQNNLRMKIVSLSKWLMYQMRHLRLVHCQYEGGLCKCTWASVWVRGGWAQFHSLSLYAYISVVLRCFVQHHVAAMPAVVMVVVVVSTSSHPCFCCLATYQPTDLASYSAALQPLNPGSDVTAHCNIPWHGWLGGSGRAYYIILASTPRILQTSSSSLHFSFHLCILTI